MDDFNTSSLGPITAQDFWAGCSGVDQLQLILLKLFSNKVITQQEFQSSMEVLYFLIEKLKVSDLEESNV